MPLTPGVALGPYEIIGILGRGGMGEVYRARDQRVRRDVAIKVPAEPFTERFKHEARLVAALNHPNICSLFDVGPNYLVMELIDGQSLAERIARGPLAVREALDIARQIADALEAAHEHTVVHRDLKPGNVLIRPDGVVKVVDFGLARRTLPAPLSDETATAASFQTEVGTVVGTPAYMAPEQITGIAVDRRADIWAFGAIVYEMLTGQRPFRGATPPDTLAAILAREPSFEVLPVSVKPVIEKCLRKDPRTRWQWIGDVRLALEEAVATGEPLEGRAGRSSLYKVGLAAILVALAAATAAVSYFRAEDLPPHVVRFIVPIPGDSAEGARFAVSPDGRALAITSSEAGTRALWIHSFDSLDSRRLSGTEGADAPFWSPDSTQIGFFADGRLKRVAVAAGTPAIVADIGAVFQGATWNDDNVIVFASNGLKRVNSTGGTVAPMGVDVGRPGFLPHFLPDGRHLLFRANSIRETDSGIFVGALDGSSVQLLAAEFSNAAYAPRPGGDSGVLLFIRAGALMAQPFDERRLRAEGQTATVAEHIAGDVGRGDFSIARNGTLTFRAASLFQLTWVTRDGSTLQAIGSPDVVWGQGGGFAQSRLSPDETKLAYNRTAGQGGRANTDVWQLDLSRDVPEKVTDSPWPDLQPVWSPDSRQIAFTSNRNRPTAFDTYLITPGGEDRVLAEMPGGGQPFDWSPDGRFVLQRSNGVWIVPVDGSPPRPYMSTGIREAKFSRDGRWVAYVANDSGTGNVFVRPFPGPGAAVQVSPDGGSNPQWHRDGGELFYVAHDGMLTAVPVADNGAGLVFGRPTRLFQAPAGYQVSADGRRFLVARPVDSAPPAITVVLNWLSRFGN